MDVVQFEDKRWSTQPQKEEFRHTQAVSLITSGKVLDVGCGDGLLLSMLREKDIEGTGLDVSPEAVRKCRAKGFAAEVFDPNRPFPFPDKYFDHVVLLDVLEHVYAPEELLSEAKRVSKGDIIISVPNFSSLPARIQVLLGKVPENNTPHKGHVYWFTYSVLKTLAKKSGLYIEELRVNSFGPFARIPWLTKSFPSILALSFVAQLKSTA